MLHRSVLVCGWGKNHVFESLKTYVCGVWCVSDWCWPVTQCCSRMCAVLLLAASVCVCMCVALAHNDALYTEERVPLCGCHSSRVAQTPRSLCVSCLMFIFRAIRCPRVTAVYYKTVHLTGTDGCSSSNIWMGELELQHRPEVQDFTSDLLLFRSDLLTQYIVGAAQIFHTNRLR